MDTQPRNQSPTQREAADSRRSFLRKGLAVGAGTVAAGLLPKGIPVFAEEGTVSGRLTQGDAAILRFLAAAEILESDLWQQYNELGGIQDSEVPGGSGSKAYTAALQVLDGDMPQYIHDNTEDEISHFTFINAYLAAQGAEPVNLNRFRTLPSSRATGAQQIGRLTNLMCAPSWYIQLAQMRLRSLHLTALIPATLLPARRATDL